MNCGCRWKWRMFIAVNLSNWKEEAWQNQGLNGIRTHDLLEYRCDALPTELWSHTLGARSIYWVHISSEEWNGVKFIWIDLSGVIILHFLSWSIQNLFLAFGIFSCGTRRVGTDTNFIQITHSTLFWLLLTPVGYMPMVSNWKILNYKKNQNQEGRKGYYKLFMHVMLGVQMCWITWNGKTLEARRFHTKATLMYRIFRNDLSAPNWITSL